MWKLASPFGSCIVDPLWRWATFLSHLGKLRGAQSGTQQFTPNIDAAVPSSHVQSDGEKQSCGWISWLEHCAHLSLPTPHPYPTGFILCTTTHTSLGMGSFQPNTQNGYSLSFHSMMVICFGWFQCTRNDWSGWKIFVLASQWIVFNKLCLVWHRPGFSICFWCWDS